MEPPPFIQATLDTILSGQVEIHPVSGGMINQAARVRSGWDQYFLKWNADAPEGLFAAEADGLEALRATNTLRVPQPLLVRDSDATEVPFLLLEWLEPSIPADIQSFSWRFAERLAELHSQPVGEHYGWAGHNFLGTSVQNNAFSVDWPSFWRDLRLEPQIQLAKNAGLLPTYREAMLNQLCDGLPNLLAGMDQQPSLIHGDLWSGNYLSTIEGPTIFDPAVYYAPREVELAFIELFGGFPPNFVRNYREVAPVSSGYEQRRPIHQLYYLLVHLNTFGEEYGAAVDKACLQAIGVYRQ